MKKILLIGNGAREHVIAETLKKSPQNISLVAYGKTVNPGIKSLSDAYAIGNVTDLAHIKKFAQEQEVSFAIVGPEDPIAAGVTDELLTLGIHTVAPLKSVARLESSKAFTRYLFKQYQIPGNPLFEVFESSQGMKYFVDRVSGNFVVKADGLMAGKGVKVSGDHFSKTEEGLAYAEECIRNDGRVVLEERLIGQEFSLMSFCDGVHVSHMPAVQDHKRAYEDDRGPNTGGMGTYSDPNHSLPFLQPSDIEAAKAMNQRVAEALFQETGCQFKGILYGGFMAVKDGIRLIEYNVRFGDPEAMNVLPLLKNDFVEVCEALLHGHLDKLSLQFEEKATVCKYVVPEGYPDHPIKGAPVEIGNIPPSVRVYFASVDAKQNSLILCGSRAIAVVGIADNLPEAERFAEQACGVIDGPVFHRKDIGTAVLIEKRVAMMKELRGITPSSHNFRKT